MAKLTDDQLRFIIDIEATGAQGQINTLSAEIGKLEKQNASLSSSLTKVNNELAKQEKKLAKMEAAGKTNTAAYRQLSAAVDANRQKQAQLSTQLKQTQNTLDKDREKVAQFTSSLKLNQMTMQQLRERASQLRKQLDVTSKAASPETFKRLSSELAKTEAQMGKLGKKSSMVADVFKGAFGANMASRAIIALFNAIRGGIGNIVSFEAANASLASVLGTTQEGVKRLTEDAKRLGAVTEYTASQVTMMQTELAKLGFNETEILQSTESILQFATATGSNIPEAAQLAGAALRAFGLDASEMSRVVSTMAVAVLENVKLGRITSSPLCSPQSRAAISSAVVPLVVKRTFWAPKRSSSHAWHFLVNCPSPQILCASIACFTYVSSVPTKGGTLKEIILFS